MDSRDVKTSLGCSATGLVLTATITRSAYYNGSAAKNLFWRPIIAIAAILYQLGAVFDVEWRMRLPNGKQAR